MNRIVILIVDDDHNICEFLMRLLKPLGCTLEIAYTLADGLARMERIPNPSFIFLDLNLPDSTPENTINSIPRFRQFNPRCAISVITGMRDEKIQQMATAIGAHSFRQKTDLRSQEDALNLIEETIKAGETQGIEPYEVTTMMLERVHQIRASTNVAAAPTS